MVEHHLYEAISDITKYAMMSGDVTTGSLDYEGPDGHRRLGISIIRNNYKIDIQAAPHEGMLNMFYALSLTDSARNSITDSEAIEKSADDIGSLSLNEIKDTIAANRVARLDVGAEEFGDQIDPQIESNIHHLYSESNSGDEYWDGFQCYERMYAFDDSFRAQDYDNKMRKFVADIRVLIQAVDDIIPDDSITASSDRGQSEEPTQKQRGFQ